MIVMQISRETILKMAFLGSLGTGGFVYHKTGSGEFTFIIVILSFMFYGVVIHDTFTAIGLTVYNQDDYYE